MFMRIGPTDFVPRFHKPFERTIKMLQCRAKMQWKEVRQYISICVASSIRPIATLSRSLSLFLVLNLKRAKNCKILPKGKISANKSIKCNHQWHHRRDFQSNDWQEQSWEKALPKCER